MHKRRCTFLALIAFLVTADAPAHACLFDQTQSHDITVKSDNEPRHYLLHLPQQQSAMPAPLVIVLHAFGESAAAMESLSGFSAMADRQGFIAAYPEAETGGWRFAQQDSQKDVDFIRAVIGDIAARMPVDTGRIILAGLSNGAQMAWRMGCVAPDLFAAIAPVAGSYPLYDDCQSSLPLPVIAFHGTADKIMPYYGRFIQFGPRAFMRGRTAQNRCDPKPARAIRSGMIAEQWSDCRYGADAAFYTIPGGAHAWPSGAEELIWDFSEHHARR